MLKTKYAYCPFNENGLLGYVRRTIRSFHSGLPFSDKFDQQIRIHDNTGTVLRDISYKKEVYVFGHGSAESDYISDNQHNRIALADLPGMMMLDGLSTAQKVVKLFSCQSAQGDLVQTMAAKFSRYMAVFFPDVIVYGYTESLLVMSGGLGNAKRGRSGARAKDIRVGFKNGQPIGE